MKLKSILNIKRLIYVKKRNIQEITSNEYLDGEIRILYLEKLKKYEELATKRITKSTKVKCKSDGFKEVWEILYVLQPSKCDYYEDEGINIEVKIQKNKEKIIVNIDELRVLEEYEIEEDVLKNTIQEVGNKKTIKGL